VDDGVADCAWTKRFVDCRWFMRGWTLQELITGRHVVFYTNEWPRIGTKGDLC
jgi:hypothetical protein